MALYQLQIIKNEKIFEEFICDLFNEIENTESFPNTEFQNFGVKGQKQNGIDVFSPRTNTVIQCKLKDVSKKQELIRKNLMEDIDNDLQRAFGLQFEIRKFIFVSTFKDDRQLQEFTSRRMAEAKLPFPLYYWGWDTLCKYAEQYESILIKYFPVITVKGSSKQSKKTIIFPDGALGNDLAKKNYISYLSRRYGEWKQIEFDKKGNAEKFNWASHNKGIINRYHAAGINFIPILHFDDIVKYLTNKINKTIFGKSQISKGRRNYSTLAEHEIGLLD